MALSKLLHAHSLALKECSVELLSIGTLIVGMIGQGKTRGMSALTKIEATINQNLAAVIPSKRVKSDFLHFVFQAAYKSLRDIGRGTNQAALNCELISQFKIALPELDEQVLIVKHLEEQLLTIDGLLSEVDISIGYLQEHRTALISAAVTGKIDVRNH
jgi:type I restriction enzyme S subunit